MTNVQLATGKSNQNNRPDFILALAGWDIPSVLGTPSAHLTLINTTKLSSLVLGITALGITCPVSVCNRDCSLFIRKI